MNYFLKYQKKENNFFLSFLLKNLFFIFLMPHCLLLKWHIRWNPFKVQQKKDNLKDLYVKLKVKPTLFIIRENLLCFKVVWKKYARKKDMKQPIHNEKINSKNNETMKLNQDLIKKRVKNILVIIWVRGEWGGWGGVEEMIDGKRFCVKYSSLLWSLVLLRIREHWSAKKELKSSAYFLKSVTNSFLWYKILSKDQ